MSQNGMLQLAEFKMPSRTICQLEDPIKLASEKDSCSSYHLACVGMVTEPFLCYLAAVLHSPAYSILNLIFFPYQ